MKAESIEQIREHLARAGRVILHSIGKNEYPVKEIDPMIACLDGRQRFRRAFNSPFVDYWELVPIEEEKPLPGTDVRTLPLVKEDPTGESAKQTTCLPIETAKSCLACLDFMIDDFMTRQYAGLDYKTLADARDQLRKAVEAEE